MANKKGISLIEYAILLTIILVALVAMKIYMQRSMQANWGKTGQSFAFGRQYDAQKTIECTFDRLSNQWYDQNCYDQYVHNNGCYYVTQDFCADGSACNDPGNNCQNGNSCCKDGSLCGVASCQEHIISSGVCSTSSCNGAG